MPTLNGVHLVGFILTHSQRQVRSLGLAVPTQGDLQDLLPHGGRCAIKHRLSSSGHPWSDSSPPPPHHLILASDCLPEPEAQGLLAFCQVVRCSPDGPNRADRAVGYQLRPYRQGRHPELTLTSQSRRDMVVGVGFSSRSAEGGRVID